MRCCPLCAWSGRVLVMLAVAGTAAGALKAWAEPPGVPPSPVPPTPKIPPVKTDKPGDGKPTPPTPPTPPVTKPKDEPPGKDHPPRKDDKPADGAKTTDAADRDPAYMLGFTMKRIDGTEQALTDYKGKVVMIVNTASKCGYTPQYAGLQKLYEDKKDAGLVVLAFPANNFGKQEPGSNQEIQEFCTSKFHVTFPMFEKVDVKGDSAAPLFKRLAGLPAPIGGEPKWNFTKFLVDRRGRVVARFEPGTTPEDKKLLAKVDELLAEKVAETPVPK